MLFHNKTTFIFVPRYTPKAMQEIIRNTTNDNLVNYSSVSTSAINTLEYTPTESHESLSFLMKNNVLLKFSLFPQTKEEKEEEQKELDKEQAYAFSFY